MSAPPEVPDPTRFTDSLAVELSLPGLLGATSIPGANVKELSLQLHPWGFCGQIVFWMPAAEGADVHGRVTDPDLLELELKLARRHYMDEPPTPLSLKGVVTARSFVEITAKDVLGSPVLFRKYTLQVADAARALWSQHRPTAVYAKTALQTIIQQHAVAPIPVKLAWAAAKSKRPIVCLSLGEDVASFYDFVCWLSDEEQGHFTFDYTTKMFGWSDKKPWGLTAAALSVGICAEARVHVAEPPRFAVNVLNSHAQGTTKTAVENTRDVDGLAHDVLMHTPLAQDTKDREALEKKRLRAGKPELEILCKAFPEVYVAPGSAAKLDGEEWSGHLHHAGETLRTIEVRLEARATDDSPEHDLGLGFTDYAIRLSYRFEYDDDPRVRLPAYTRPRNALVVEGKIQSTLGDAGDRAFMVYEDEKTSRDTYKVLLSVWNATIEVPFIPGYQPGHMYFPAYKDQRVLLKLGFDWARIEGFLDWGPSVRVPTGSQGNHILFGKNSTSETSMRNWYVDAKPEFQIKRVHNGDTGVVTVKDGVISIETFDTSLPGMSALPTVSLKAEAEASKAKAEGETDLAASDLEGAIESLGGGLGGEVQGASGVVKEQAGALEADVRGRAEAASGALASVGADAEAASTRAKELVEDARRKIKGLFEGE
jgi:hypothetical protein